MLRLRGSKHQLRAALSKNTQLTQVHRQVELFLLRRLVFSQSRHTITLLRAIPIFYAENPHGAIYRHQLYGSIWIHYSRNKHILLPKRSGLLVRSGRLMFGVQFSLGPTNQLGAELLI